MFTLEDINEKLMTYNIVQEIQIQMDQNTFSYDLLLILQKSADDYQDNFRIHFIDVGGLKLEGLGGGLTQLMLLKITKDNNGLERIKYYLEELEEEKISFSFFKYELVDE